MTAKRRVSDFVYAHARATPDAVAMTVNGRQTTYRALAAQIDALAAALIAAGVRNGDRVATLSTPHPDFVVTFLAATSIGAIWIGLNPRYHAEELAYVVSDAEPAILFTRTAVGDRTFADDLALIRTRAPSLRAVVAFDGETLSGGETPMAEFLEAGHAIDTAQRDAARAEAGGRTPCVIVYTSGSTGRPKGAVLHHEGIADFAEAQNRLWPVSPLNMVNYFPINHVGSVVDVTMPTLAAGGCVSFLEQFDPHACLALMQAERTTLWGSVPSVFAMMLAQRDFAAFDLSALQLIVWEGAAMPAELIGALLKLGPPLATNYSMTETTGAITALAPTRDAAALASTVGEVFPGVEVRLASEGDAPGEVLVRSPYTMLGYWRRPEASAEALDAEGWFRTGDLAVLLPDGRYRIVGRLKEMYKSGGYNVYPREVEAVLEAHPDVTLAAVVAAPDPLWQEVGVAFVVGAPRLSESAIQDWCRTRLANYKVPKRVVVEARLPLLPIGKVDKAALRRRAEAMVTQRDGV